MAGRTLPSADQDFPCSLIINIPLPTPRLATIALRALSVDAELSPLVRRTFALTSASLPEVADATPLGEETILRTHYEATTNRMLRVAVNGFFESVGVVLATMRELDVDVATDEWRAGLVAEGETGEERDIRELKKVQGLTEAGRIG